MRQLFKVLPLFFYAIQAFSMEASDFLTIAFKDGTIIQYAMSERPTLCFGENELTVNAQGSTTVYSLNDITNFSYEDITRIPQVCIEKKVKLVENGIFFNSLLPNDEVHVYDSNGKGIFHLTNNNSAEYFLSWDSLNTEICLIIINGKTIKVRK